MKILVTGGAGFIGSHVVDTYVALGHDVTVVDDLSSGRKKHVNPKATFVTMDVRDPNISTLFGKCGFDIVNHLAAQIDVRRSMQDPFFDASVNILGTLRLLDCCRTYGVRKFIFSSSGGVMYGECKGKPASEKAETQPVSPYGFSKATAERYIRFFGDAFRLPYTILRYGNVYGPRQDPHGEAGVVAIFAGKLINNERVTIFGTGKQERDYIFVADVVEANSAALLKGENAILNVGTGMPTSVNALYERLSTLNKSIKSPIYAPPRAGELESSVLNAQQAKVVLGWTAKTSIRDGLAATLDYFSSSVNKTSSKK